MTMDPRNVVNLTAGVVADPEIHNDKVARIRVAVDYAGRDKTDENNRTGYFNVTYFLNEDSPNGKFVSSQIRDGKMKKGSQVIIAGSLEQQRWEGENGKRQDVAIIADAITYASGGKRDDGEGSDSTASRVTTSAPEASAPVEF